MPSVLPFPGESSHVAGVRAIFTHAGITPTNNK